ncbi:Rpn family recombination-promoting nuclease/putative transposase [Clostridium estertheticum]|uniref:Rpn family recombination-promoting nuclease/putative transposase n=1 Tax=Clostridium estertheticum TaxID=238834 RepID=UPI001C6EE5AB|nr:Rpn family recombination-promoting nuclease/putative transposase [Clostridium estertheticum]MBW9173602.1 Rpn family recombination-promoting nuclease/putative transposase [Clostridium estertheticum]WLC75234.1 Rpn family recombination-promoting nuclease/putative transposase [Clostridium estertheticum]
MAKIDVPIKRLMQSRLEEWVEYLIPNCNREWITEMDAEKIPAKKESRLDKLIMIDAPNERYILNIEPQGYLDYKMPARMLRYKSDIWEYTIEKGMGIPSIKQVVIYFYKEHDNKQYILEDSWNGEETLKFSYKAIKIWEMEKDPVIKKKLIGLYPLIPLMGRNHNETDDELMEETVTTIKTVENEALQADLLAVTSILAGERLSNELVKKYIRRDMLMSSPLFNEWVEEERKEAAQKAQIETTRKNILALLSEKFDFVPKNIIESVMVIDDIAVLDWLVKKIIKVETIENFEHLIEEAMRKK